MESIAWMAWTLPTAIFFVALASTLAVMTCLAAVYPEAERVGVLTLIPGAVVIWFVRNYIAKGFALGRV